MFIHDVIKRMYINMGYLPGQPYYLISDAEMFDAFLREKDGFFHDFYPCPDESLREYYDNLLNFIKIKIHEFLESNEEVTLPDWIYSYMIMRPITFESDEADIKYLNDLANIELPLGAPEFTVDTAQTCYEVSKKWIQKQPSKHEHRPPTVFGETLVTKSLRLDQSNILLDSEVS